MILCVSHLSDGAYRKYFFTGGNFRCFFASNFNFSKLNFRLLNAFAIGFMKDYIKIKIANPRNDRFVFDCCGVEVNSQHSQSNVGG